jgi:4-hydroxybenzoate polyprenyltransferase
MVKLGLGDSYSNTIIPKKIRAYADIMKPASSIGVMFTIPFGAIIYAHITHGNGLEFLSNNLADIIYASVTVMLLHGSSQAMNMAEDAHIDKQTDHKQNRPIPSGVISEEEARSLAWIFMFLGVARAFTINTQFGLFSVILALLGIFYNLDPIRAKKHLWVNLVWQAASRGLLLYPAAFAVWGAGFTPTPWGMGVVAFFLVLSLQNSADLPDIEMDRKYDIITPAVYHGPRKLVEIMLGIALIMFGVFIMFIEYSIIPNFWSIYLLSIPIGLSLAYLWHNPKGVSSISGQSTVWYVYYGSLAGLYILPALQLVLI